MANVLTAACDTISGMSRRSDARGEDDRRRFVADPDVLAALDLKFEQLSDPDVRSVVIRHEHPEFEQALKEDRRQIEGSDGPMNPRLHLTLHEIVATQLWDDSPPEVWDTAVRLLDAGYERHEILHMLARPVSDQVWEALHDERPYDHERHVAALHALPAPGSGSARPRRRQGATTTPQAGSSGSASGKAAQSTAQLAPDDPRRFVPQWVGETSGYGGGTAPSLSLLAQGETGAWSGRSGRTFWRQA